MYPNETPTPFAYAKWSNLRDAIRLAVDCHIPIVLPGLIYAHITTSDVEASAEPTYAYKPISEEPPTPANFTGWLSELSTAALHELIAHFTPILFTMPAARHMECTDALAEHWESLVLAPTLAEPHEVARPLETLERIVDIRWETLGVCYPCTEEKRQEWRDEQKAVLEKLPGWTGLDQVKWMTLEQLSDRCLMSAVHSKGYKPI